ncbi:6172_t:CDS:2, partial [Gigaspora rosea]
PGIPYDDVLKAYSGNSELIQELKTRCFTSPIPWNHVLILPDKNEAREYIHTRWISEDFFSSDIKSTKISQPYTLIDPKFTFVKKFLERRQQRLITLSLPPQIIQPTPIDYSEIPIQYMTLLESEIFNEGSSNSTPEQ